MSRRWKVKRTMREKREVTKAQSVDDESEQDKRSVDQRPWLD
jgi:hypothetical protein